MKQKRKRKERKHNKTMVKQNAANTRRVHEVVKDKLIELGQILGMACKKEHSLVKKGPVVLDAVWYDEHAREFALTHAFEVQNNGNLKNAIHNLEAAGRHNPSCRLCLVIVDKKELKVARQLLGKTMNKRVKVMSSAEIEDLHRTVKGSFKRVLASRREIVGRILSTFG